MADWDRIPIEKWQRLLAHVVELGDFDLDAAALDAELDPEQTAVMKAWCRQVERDAEARAIAGEMPASTIRHFEELLDLPGLDPDLRAGVAADLEKLKARPKRR